MLRWMWPVVAVWIAACPAIAKSGADKSAAGPETRASSKSDDGSASTRPATKTTGKTTKASVPSIAVFQLSEEIREKPPEIMLGFDLETRETLYELIRRMDKAGKDRNVKAVVLTFDEPVMGWAQMQELRAALVKLRKANKDVYCYLEEAGGGLYQLASAASKICLAPAGELDLTGLHVETAYFKGLLDKIHLEADIEHMGAYKGAGEPFTRTGPSPEARAMHEWLVKDLFEQMVETIAEGRHMTAERVRALIDDGPFNAAQALDAQLVDEVIDADAFLDTLYERYGEEAELVRDYGVEEAPAVDLSSPFAFFKLFGESISKKKTKGKASVAVAFLDGMIVTGRTEPGIFSDGGEVGSTTVRRMLARLREDDQVKAVVIRVDSPGGSALASDIMWQAVRDLADVKPTVISMGNVAASGGYYLSVGAPTIFADAGTITGSIGVIGGKLVTKGLWDWLGVSFDEITLGRNADLLNTNRRFDDRQRELIRKQLQHVYSLFRERVTEGRKDKLAKEIEEIAGGRVYTGKQAKALGLVDEIGGLDQAIVFVADKAGVTDYDVRQLPEPKNLLDLIMDGMSGRTSSDEEGGGISLKAAGKSALRAKDGPRGARWLFTQPVVRELIEAMHEAEPARARWLKRALLRLELFRRGGALMLMPEELLVR